MPDKQEFQLPKLHYVVESTAENRINYPADDDPFSIYNNFDKKTFDTIEEAIAEYKDRLNINNCSSIEDGLNKMLKRFPDKWGFWHDCDEINIIIYCYYDRKDLKKLNNMIENDKSLEKTIKQYKELDKSLYEMFGNPVIPRDDSILILSHDWIDSDLRDGKCKDKRIMDSVNKVKNEILGFDFSKDIHSKLKDKESSVNNQTKKGKSVKSKDEVIR